MTVDHRAIGGGRAVGASPDIATAAADPIAAQAASMEAGRVDRVYASEAARRSIASGIAPRCLTIDGLERMRRSVDIGEGRRLILEWGLYRVGR